MLSPLKPIPLQSLLHKTTTCLTPLVTTFFPSDEKKNFSKTATANLFPASKWEAMYKKLSFQLYVLYCYLVLQILFNVYKNWTLTFKI